MFNRALKNGYALFSVSISGAAEIRSPLRQFVRVRMLALGRRISTASQRSAPYQSTALDDHRCTVTDKDTSIISRIAAVERALQNYPPINCMKTLPQIESAFDRVIMHASGIRTSWRTVTSYIANGADANAPCGLDASTHGFPCIRSDASLFGGKIRRDSPYDDKGSPQREVPHPLVERHL
jgi:hypothetical protein